MIKVGQEVIIIRNQEKKISDGNFVGCIGTVVEVDDKINNLQYKVDVIDNESSSLYRSVPFSDNELLPVKMATVR